MTETNAPATPTLANAPELADATADPVEHADADDRTSVDALRTELATIAAERTSATTALEQERQAAHDAFAERDAAAVERAFADATTLEARLGDLNARYDAGITALRRLVQADVECCAEDARVLCAQQHRDQQDLIARFDRLVTELMDALDDAQERIWRQHHAERSGLIQRLDAIANGQPRPTSRMQVSTGRPTVPFGLTATNWCCSCPVCCGALTLRRNGSLKRAQCPFRCHLT